MAELELELPATPVVAPPAALPFGTPLLIDTSNQGFQSAVAVVIDSAGAITWTNEPIIACIRLLPDLPVGSGKSAKNLVEKDMAILFFGRHRETKITAAKYTFRPRKSTDGGSTR